VQSLGQRILIGELLTEHISGYPAMGLINSVPTTSPCLSFSRYQHVMFTPYA
jgi:hypothetical protein